MRHGKEEPLTSSSLLAFRVDFKLFSVPVPRELTNGTYKLVCDHAKEFCEGVCTSFLSATTARLLFDEMLSDEDYPYVHSVQRENCPL